MTNLEESEQYLLSGTMATILTFLLYLSGTFPIAIAVLFAVGFFSNWFWGFFSAMAQVRMYQMNQEQLRSLCSVNRLHRRRSGSGDGWLSFRHSRDCSSIDFDRFRAIPCVHHRNSVPLQGTGFGRSERCLKLELTRND